MALKHGKRKLPKSKPSIQKVNSSRYTWEAPVPYPNDDNAYVWNEQTQAWDLVD